MHDSNTVEYLSSNFEADYKNYKEQWKKIKVKESFKDNQKLFVTHSEWNACIYIMYRKCNRKIILYGILSG